MSLRLVIASNLLFFIYSTHTHPLRTFDLHPQENISSSPNHSPIHQPVEQCITNIIHALFGIVKDPHNKESRVNHIRTILFNIFQIATTFLYTSQHKTYSDTITLSSPFIAELQTTINNYAHELPSSWKQKEKVVDYNKNHTTKTNNIYDTYVSNEYEIPIVENINDMLAQCSLMTRQPNNTIDTNIAHLITNITTLTRTFAIPVHLYNTPETHTTIITTLAYTLSPKISVDN